MKKLKKLVGLILALAMVFGLSVTSFAAPTTDGSITINGVATSSHTFTAYQVFTGEYDSSSGKLSNVEWGKDVDGSTLITSLKQDATIGSEFSSLNASTATASDVADILTSSYFNSADNIEAFASVVAAHLTASGTSSTTPTESSGTYTYKISNLTTGYYVVIDSDAASTATVADSNSRYIVQVLGAEEIDTKAVVPSVTKNVVDTSTKGTSASAGDTVHFILTSTVPSDLSGYTTYTYKIIDTMTDGLTYDSTDSSVNNLSVTYGSGSVVSYTSSFDSTTNTLTITINGAKSLAGQTITVEYDAELNSKAEAGDPETNTVYVEYSNNPTSNGSGDTDTTPKDKVYVYTFELEVTKTTSDNSTLPSNSVGFTLYKYDGVSSYVQVGNEVFGDTSTKFNFEDLGAGTYKLVETTTPAGYNTAADVVFTITANYKTDGTIDTLTANNNVISVTSVSSGELTTSIENRLGSTLPTTGGIGTTIFYIVGGVIVLGAAVLLITRKRVRKA